MSYNSIKYTKHYLTPLTEENLDKMNNHSCKDTILDPLSIYCLSTNEAPGINPPRISTPVDKKSASYKRPKRRSRDMVVESPRLLPFPYHNDGQFLPTVERNQHHYQKRRTCGSLTDLSLRSKRTSVSPSAHSTTISYCPQRSSSAPPVNDRLLFTPKEPKSASRHPSYRMPSPSPSTTSSSSSSPSSFVKMETFFVRLIGAIRKKNKSP